MRIYREEYKEELKAHRLLCKDVKQLYDKEYFQQHKEAKRRHRVEYDRQHRAELNAHYNQRYARDIHFRLKKLLRRRILLVLDTNPKLTTTMKLVGCSIQDFRLHLEKQFKLGMSWSNQGLWHIDHIQPCKSFDLRKPAEQKKCFHYNNLQPLWAKENISKGARW